VLQSGMKNIQAHIVASCFCMLSAIAANSSTEIVASDLASRAAKFKAIKIGFDSTSLTAREIKMVGKLVEAAGLADSIFWRQSDPEGLQLYLSLASSADPKDQLLRRYLKINGGRFDLVDNNKPFVGSKPMSPGRAFYPEDLTREQLEAYVAKHPNLKSSLYAPQTMVVREKGELRAHPYHVAFKEFLVPMATLLEEAAALSDDSAFAHFLKLRAAALLNDDYFASDLAWVDLKNPKFDVVFAPYESYLDDLLGVKTSYGMAVMIRNDTESKKLEVFQKYVPQLQESLPLRREDLPSKKGQNTPMEIMDAIYRSGDLLHGYQAVADSLPNDPRIHEQKGTKKIFWKNFMDARVNFVIVPLAKRLMTANQANMVTGEGTLDFIVMHEISHGLGPAYARTAAGKADLREAMGAAYGAIEEAKADITGLLCMKWLVEHDVIAKENLNGIYASYLGESLRTIRYGIAEAHGAASMMEIQYLTEQGAIFRNSSGLYEMDFGKMPKAVAMLAKELLEQEATGGKARAEKWFAKYAVMATPAAADLAKATDIPVDVDPSFDYNPPLR